MATRMSLGDTSHGITPGISPEQARADYLARSLEEIRRFLSTPLKDRNQVLAALRRVSGVLDRIPPQV
ncbi:MAG: hypothetical protein WAT66_14780 [Actinomycetota bacterium]